MMARLVLHVHVYCFARGTDPCIAVPRLSVINKTLYRGMEESKGDDSGRDT